MYFKNFPKIILDGVTGATGSSVMAVDILRRVAFSSGGKTGSEFFLNYYVRDEDTPESISEKIYGSPEFHWVVMLFNDKFDTFFEWSMNQNKFENYIKKKYPGVTLFLGSSGGTYGVTGSFAKNDTVIKTDGTGTTGWGGLVREFDPVLNKITITGLVAGEEFSVDDTIKSYNASGGTLVSQNVGESTVRKVITESSQSLHHFENSGSTFSGYDDVGGGYETTKIWLDPLSKYNGTTQISMGSGGVTYGETLLYSYVESGSSTYVVTDVKNEENKKKEKQKISLLNPTFLDQVVKEFKTLINRR